MVSIRVYTDSVFHELDPPAQLFYLSSAFINMHTILQPIDCVFKLYLIPLV